MGNNGSDRGPWSAPSSIQPLFHSQLPPSADLAVAIFLTFTGIASVLGNGAVLLVYCRKRRKLRPPEVMTINLALCDFGFSLLGVPFFIISSLCHAWVFGETGCLWYGVQGFVFGIGSLLTTCLISLDRCLKICCLRYGQWIEKRHVYLSLALLWVYTIFWASLPAFGFGSYGAEPYGTSCTISWWSIRSSLSDRVYVALILVLCFGCPTLAIVASYVAILLTVYRSNHTLASMSSCSVRHVNKDLRLAKMAAVVCASFLLAWTPYAAVSLVSAVVLRGRQDAENALQEAVEGPKGSVLTSPNTPTISDVPSLLTWTATQSYRLIYSNQNRRDDANANPSSGLNDTTDSLVRSPHAYSGLPPVVTLIPAMLAKSHCMINPLIYHVMSTDFRNDMYALVLGKEKARRRKDSLCQSNTSFYCGQRRRGKKQKIELKKRKSWVEDTSVVADTLD